MAEERPSVVLEEEGKSNTLGPKSRARRDALWLHVGAAMSGFSYLETNLMFLFSVCIGLPINVAARMLAPTKNFSLTLSIINVVVCHKVTPLGALPYWASLYDYIIELSGDRNYIAHTGIVYHGAGHPELTVSQDALEPKIGPSVSSHLMEDLRKDPMPLHEVIELCRDFDQASGLVQALQLALPQSLPEKFFQPIVRRRPPRDKRRAAKAPKHPSRPPSSRPRRDKKKERDKK